MGITTTKAKKYRKDTEDHNQGVQFQNELKTIIRSPKRRETAFTVVRLVGDAAWCMRAWIPCDDQKTRPFQMTKDSILYRLYDHVMSYTIANQKRIYTFEDTEAFELVTGGGDFRAAWRPRHTYLMNCIPRQADEDADVNIAAENEHLTLLVGSKADIGIPPTAWDALLSVAENDDDTDLYDIVFTKKGKGTDTEYGALKASHRNEDYGEFVSRNEQITAEERSWEAYDLDALAAETSASVVVKHLEATIRDIDRELKCGYLEELQEAAEREEAKPAGTKAKAKTRAGAARKRTAATTAKKTTTTTRTRRTK